MFEVNWLAVVAAAAAGWILGGLWYSPFLFLPAWQRAARVETPAPPSPLLFFELFVLQFISAAGLAIVEGLTPPLARSGIHGLIVGILFVSTSLAINYEFSGRNWRLLLINGGYHTLRFVLFGLIIGAWH